MKTARTGGGGFNRRGGAGKVNLVIPSMIIVLVLGVYLALKFVPPYTTDYTFKNYLLVQTRNAFDWTNRTIEQNIRTYAQDEHIPLKDEDLSVFRSENVLQLHVQYRVIVNLPFELSRQLTFRHDLDTPIKPKKEL